MQNITSENKSYFFVHNYYKATSIFNEKTCLEICDWIMKNFGYLSFFYITDTELTFKIHFTDPKAFKTAPRFMKFKKIKFIINEKNDSSYRISYRLIRLKK